MKTPDLVVTFVGKPGTHKSIAARVVKGYLQTQGMRVNVVEEREPLVSDLDCDVIITTKNMVDLTKPL